MIVEDTLVERFLVCASIHKLSSLKQIFYHNLFYREHTCIEVLFASHLLITYWLDSVDDNHLVVI
jgi:hypothetical protein